MAFKNHMIRAGGLLAGIGYHHDIAKVTGIGCGRTSSFVFLLWGGWPTQDPERRWKSSTLNKCSGVPHTSAALMQTSE